MAICLKRYDTYDRYGNMLKYKRYNCHTLPKGYGSRYATNRESNCSIFTNCNLELKLISRVVIMDGNIF